MGLPDGKEAEAWQFQGGRGTSGKRDTDERSVSFFCVSTFAFWVWRDGRRRFAQRLRRRQLFDLAAQRLDRVDERPQARRHMAIAGKIQR